MIVAIVNGKIYIDGNLCTDAELIGYALLDFAEQTAKDKMKIVLKEGDVFVG